MSAKWFPLKSKAHCEIEIWRYCLSSQVKTFYLMGKQPDKAWYSLYLLTIWKWQCEVHSMGWPTESSSIPSGDRYLGKSSKMCHAFLCQGNKSNDLASIYNTRIHFSFYELNKLYLCPDHWRRKEAGLLSARKKLNKSKCKEVTSFSPITFLVEHHNLLNGT